MNPVNATGPASGGGDQHVSALRRLVLEAPYGPAVVKTETDPANSRITYKISVDDLGVIVTVQPEHGGGHTAIARGLALHLTCNDIHDTATIADPDPGPRAGLGDPGGTVDIPAGLLPGAGIDPGLLTAVLRAVIRDWVNRPDANRLRRRAAARTAPARLPLAERRLAELQANLAELLSELEDQHHTVGELRGLAAEHRDEPGNEPGPYEPAADEPSLDGLAGSPAPVPNAMERAMRAAGAVAAHARHLEPGTTAIDVLAPPVAAYAVTDLFVDLLHLLDMAGVDPADLIAAASDIYETQHAEHPGAH